MNRLLTPAEGYALAKECLAKVMREGGEVSETEKCIYPACRCVGPCNGAGPRDEMSEIKRLPLKPGRFAAT